MPGVAYGKSLMWRRCGNASCEAVIVSDDGREWICPACGCPSTLCGPLDESRRNEGIEEAPCVIPGVGTDRGRDGRLHVFDCGKVLNSSEDRCDAEGST